MKQRMNSPRTGDYRERGSTIETINGDLKQWRTLAAFTVRGSASLCVLLLNAIAYNILRWATLTCGHETGARPNHDKH